MGDIGVSKDALRAVIPLTGEFVGTTDTQTITTKTISVSSNSLTATSGALGDTLAHDGTSYVRKAKGASGAAYRVNSAGTDTDFGTLTVAGGGTGATTLTGILKGAGTGNITAVAAPTGAILGDSDTQNITGGKTFSNSILKLRNPANTFTGSVLNPALTADANLQLAENSIGGYIVYVDNTTGQYTAKGADLNNVISAGAVAETAISAALTAAGSRGTVIIRASTYTLSGAFTGFNVGYGQRILMEPGTIIKIPTGFAGVVFTLNSTNVSQLARIEGGLLWEETTPSRLWTAFLLDSPNASLGLVTNSIERTKVINAGVGLKLKTDGTGWITDCYFERLFFDECIIAVLFENSGGSTGASSCMFVQCQVQWRTGVTTHGFKDISGSRNVFLNCYPVDFISPSITSNIASDSRFANFYGGTMTYCDFIDASLTGSYITDQYLPNMQCSPRVKKMGRYFGCSPAASFDGMWTSMGTLVGNTGAILKSSAGLRFQHNTSATINTLSGTRITVALLTERDLNPITHWKIALPTAVTTTRAFLGFTAATPVTGVDPLNGAAGVLFGYDSSVDGNWHIYQNDGTGGSNSTTIANVAAADTSAHLFSLKADNTNSKFQYSYAGGAWVNINTDIPSATASLGWAWWVENLAASARTMDVYWATTTQDA